jgi:hypothetical protein
MLLIYGYLLNAAIHIHFFEYKNPTVKVVFYQKRS